MKKKLEECYKCKEMKKVYAVYYNYTAKDFINICHTCFEKHLNENNLVGLKT